MSTKANRRWRQSLLSLAFALGVIGLVVLTVMIWKPHAAEDWAALAAGATALVALLAGMVAVHQLGEARALRREQAQPYVTVYLEPNPHETNYMELVVKNFGQTAAEDVRFKIDPEPMQAAGGGEPRKLWLPESIALLAPGQEWRTLWDSGSARYDKPDANSRPVSDLPEQHQATVSFADSGGRRTVYKFTLDWAAWVNRGSLVIYSSHHAAKALRELKEIHGRWTESNVTGGLAVVGRSGHVKDRNEKRRYRKRKRQGLWWDRSTWSRRKRLADSVQQRWLQAKAKLARSS